MFHRQRAGHGLHGVVLVFFEIRNHGTTGFTRNVKGQRDRVVIFEKHAYELALSTERIFKRELYIVLRKQRNHFEKSVLQLHITNFNSSFQFKRRICEVPKEIESTPLSKAPDTIEVARLECSTLGFGFLGTTHLNTRKESKGSIVVDLEFYMGALPLVDPAIAPRHGHRKGDFKTRTGSNRALQLEMVALDLVLDSLGAIEVPCEDVRIDEDIRSFNRRILRHVHSNETHGTIV